MRREKNNLWGWMNLEQRGRKITAGLRNLLLGVSRSARRLPSDWRYYSLPVLVLAFGVTAAYGWLNGIDLLNLPGRMLDIRGGIIQPKETDLFSQHIVNPGETENPDGAEPALPSVSPAQPQADGVLTVIPADDTPEPGEAAETAASRPAVWLAAPIEPGAGENGAAFGMTYSGTHLDWRFHDGVDYRAPGGTRVIAVGAGRVESVERTAEFDWTIVLDHGNGLKTVYANCAASLVQPGQAVGRNDQVGTVGASGLSEIADGSHLHFSVLLDGEPVDPSHYLK